MNENPSTTTGMRRHPCQARSQERVSRIIDVAEELLITQGYTVTTKEIAACAQVPIGSLYQFFPGKMAIMQTLALRHEKRLQQRLLDNPELLTRPLSVLAAEMIDIAEQYLSENLGYYVILMEVQGALSEVQAPENTADSALIQDLVNLLAQHKEGLHSADYEAIAFVLIKTIGTLMWLSLSQGQPLHQRLVAEMKRVAISYLQSYTYEDVPLTVVRD